ncbi:MAG: MFS transporter [Actinobacteria bacterium]|nr:MFS transporter [Actinomycetota bacterium]
MTSGEGHPRRWAILGVLVVSLLIVVLDNTVLNIALPTIQRDLGATQSELVWSIDSYILVFASLLFTWGILGDKYGRKKVLIIGLVLFGLASFACAFATTPGMLIGFRALMGVGGAAVLPTTLAIITVVFPPHERGKAIGAWAGAVGAAVALGPVLGGILLEHPEWSSWLTGNDWGSVFLINVPIVILGVIGIVRVVPETRNPHPRKLDLVGLVMSATGLVLLVYGIINASATKNWLAPSVIWPITFGVLIIALFLWLEARSDHPSFDVSLFRNRGYAVSLSAVSLAFFAMSGVTFSLPFYLQILRGYSTLTAGLCFLPFAIGQLIAAPRSAAMVKRFGYRTVMTTGLVFVAVAMLLLARVSMDAPLWGVLLVFFIFGFGMGNVIAPGSTVLQNVLPLARAGAGSAVQNTVRQVAGALGVAIVGTVLANQYAANLTSVIDKVPPSFPDAARQAATESIVAADFILDQAAAQGAPAAVIDMLRAGAYEAFLSASHVTSYISLAMIVIAGLLVFFLLPQITPPEKGDRAVGAPADPADALVREEIANYRDEASQEYVVPDQPEKEAQG